jgi:hypothetical protein
MKIFGFVLAIVMVFGLVSIAGTAKVPTSLTDMGDGTIKATYEEGLPLLWVKDADEGCCGNWSWAIDYCDALEFAGYNDWYLPDIDLLEGLWDYGITYSSPDPFVDVANIYYSSSTEYSDAGTWAFWVKKYLHRDDLISTEYSNTRAWAFRFKDGKKKKYLKDPNLFVAWPARTVPIPSTLLLLGSGLIGIVGLGRRKLTLMK